LVRRPADAPDEATNKPKVPKFKIIELLNLHISVAIFFAMQRPFVHPAVDDLTLESVLYALSDPTRLEIIKTLANQGCGMNCSAAAPADLPKSTLSHHFQVLREAGLIQSERRGTEVVNSLRYADLDKRFPGVVASILKASEKVKKR
jgi:DNA-binding transcriptional ArsR family regulator